jgi:hypothetical protein
MSPKKRVNAHSPHRATLQQATFLSSDEEESVDMSLESIGSETSSALSLGSADPSDSSPPVLCRPSAGRGVIVQGRGGRWLSKHVSDCCGTNVQLFYRSGGHHFPKCDFCGDDEYSSHICQCRDPGRDNMYRISAKELVLWVEATLGQRLVASTIKVYLTSHGEVPMSDCLHGSCPHLAMAAAATDRLGFDNFFEGRISQHWLLVAGPLLRVTGRYLLPPAWGRQFINKLHNIVHKQWLYRNSFIHFRGPDGLTLPEQHDIINRIEEFAFIDPETLLPRHRSFLEVDFESLGSGSTVNRLIWLANVDSAMAASTLARLGTLSTAATDHFATVPVPVPCSFSP